MTEKEAISSCNRSIEDKAYDLLGDMLTEQKTAAMLREIEEEKARGETAEMDAFFARQDQKNLKLIDAHVRRQKMRALFTKTLPRVGQIAAIIIAVIAIGGGAAIAASDTLRVQVMRLLLEPTDEYVRLSLVEDEQASFDVPTGWLGRSFPSYIPDNVEVVNILPLEEMPGIEYADRQTQEIVLRFQEFSAGVTHVDNEGATIKQVDINGHQAQLTTKNKIVNLYWSDGQSYFLVTTIDMDEETTMKIGKSVRRID